MATGGREGSLLGLKPYSSTSFRRSSSAAFFPFHLRQKYRAARIMIATDTTGTTTATAMVPPADSPESSFDEDAMAVCPPDVPDESSAVLPPVCEGDASVEVTMTVVASAALPLEED